jgi:hypothetical protein
MVYIVVLWRNVEMAQVYGEPVDAKHARRDRRVVVGFKSLRLYHDRGSHFST